MGIIDSIFGGKSSKDITAEKAPWGPQAKGLEFGFKQAATVYDQNKAKPLAGFSPTTTAALNRKSALANGPFQWGGAQDAVTGIAGGQSRIGTGGMFGDLYGQSQQPGSLSQGMFGNVASGQMVGANPFREEALGFAMDDVQNRIKASMGAKGRYGSGHMGGAMAQGLGEVATNARMAGYDTDLAAMMQGAQARSAEDLARMGVGLSAAQGQTGVEGQNLSNQMNAASLAPMFQSLKYDDANQALSVGAAYDDMEQRKIDAPWNNLANYMGMFQGDLGHVTSEPGGNPALAALGGATAGARLGGMFPGIGAGWGALGGAALGMFG